MHQLNPLDSGCLFLESPKSPLQFGGTYIFSPSRSMRSDTFHLFKEHVEQRIQLEPILRQRLRPVPLDLDDPYWVNDEGFNLDLHLSHIGLPNPPKHNTLLNLAKKLYERPLDRNRPLWEIHFIDGLDRIEGAHYEKGTFALVTKIHYALIQGETGERLFACLLDFTAKPRSIPQQESWDPEPYPNSFDTLLRCYGENLKSPMKLSKLLLKTSQAAASSIAKRAMANLKSQPNLENTPASIFDTCIENQRSFHGKQINLEPIKEAKERLSTEFSNEISLNDIILNMCAGALRSYLLQTQADSTQDLIALIPTAIKETETGIDDAPMMTNTQVTGTLISLAIQEPDTLERLRTIKESYRCSKVYKKTVPARELADYIPSIYMSVASKLYTRWHYSEKHHPYFNLVINHIPGPQIPLYLNGARLIEQYHLTPIFDGLGLVINVTSYHNKLSISVLTSDKIIPNLIDFYEHLDKSVSELLAVSRQLSKDEENNEQTHRRKAARKKSNAAANPATRKKTRQSKAENKRNSG